jgi:hypothetical protein
VYIRDLNVRHEVTTPHTDTLKLTRMARSSERIANRLADERVMLALYEAAVTCMLDDDKLNDAHGAIACPIMPPTPLLLTWAEQVMANCRTKPAHAFDVLRFDASGQTVWEYGPHIQYVAACPQCDAYIPEAAHGRVYAHYVPEVDVLHRDADVGHVEEYSDAKVRLCLESGRRQYQHVKGALLFHASQRVSVCSARPQLQYVFADAGAHVLYAVKHEDHRGCLVVRMTRQGHRDFARTQDVGRPSATLADNYMSGAA